MALSASAFLAVRSLSLSLRSMPPVVLRAGCTPFSTGLSKGSDRSAKPTLVLYTKDVCPLCDEALEALQPYRRRVSLEEVDITNEGNEGWYDKYVYEIPVFHLEGEFLCKNRLDVKKLEDRLRRLEEGK